MSTPPISHDAAEKLCKPIDPSTQEFIMQQTMYRIKDPKKSIPFYTGVLGMRLLAKIDITPLKFTLYFMGFESEEEVAEAKQRGPSGHTSWAMSRKATIELTHNWGTEDDDSKYHTGNTEPRGFGHIGIDVPDVNKACKRFEELGVEFVKKPDDGKMKGIAFIKDPDGYWIEIFSSKMVGEVIAQINA